nr:immunoglobulin light chain junction region [Macaca mulatta]
CQRYIYSTWTF